MTVENPSIIDFVAYDPATDEALLIMVEHRAWGSDGRLLIEVQEKLNTYLAYLEDGKLAADYPELSGKRVRIELRCCERPREHELGFLRIAGERIASEFEASLSWKQLGRSR